MIKLNMKKFFMVMAVILMSAMCFGQQWDELKEPCKYISPKMHIQDNIITSSFIAYPLGFNGKYRITNIYNDCGYTAIKFVNDDGCENHIKLSELDGKVNCRYNLTAKYIEFFPKRIEYAIPKVVYENYMLGDRCFKTGFAFLSVGVISTIIGVCTMKESPNISTAMYAIGGTCLSISLPLICFGDHIKRECNMNYELYNMTK